MTMPDRIWASEDKENFGEDKFFTTRPMKGLTEYIRRDPAVLAALPEVQALIAANYRKLVAEITGNPSGTKCDACRACGYYHCADAFYGCAGMRDYTLEEATAALAARDAAMMAQGMREAAEWYRAEGWKLDEDDVPDAILALTPTEAAEALAARDRAMMAKGMREAAEISRDAEYPDGEIDMPGDELRDMILARATEIERDGK